MKVIVSGCLLGENNTIKAAIHEYRGVTNVWEVVKNIEKAIALPGGIYNSSSSNTFNSYELHIKAAELMGSKDPSEWILPDEDRFCKEPRNLTMIHRPFMVPNMVFPLAKNLR